MVGTIFQVHVPFGEKEMAFWTLCQQLLRLRARDCPSAQLQGPVSSLAKPAQSLPPMDSRLSLEVQRLASRLAQDSCETSGEINRPSARQKSDQSNLLPQVETDR